jgi:cobalt-precorrin-5B (C1)-methyltransferase
MEYFLLVGNIGKLVKLAAGIMNTHSKVADGRNEIFAVHTILCGGNANLARQLMNCINTEEMLEILDKEGLREQVLQSICSKIQEHMEHRTGGKLKSGVILFSEHFGYLGETGGAEECLIKLRTKRRTT